MHFLAYQHLINNPPSATKFLDISSLALADERFGSMLRNALSYLHSTGFPVKIRFLTGPPLTAVEMAKAEAGVGPKIYHQNALDDAVSLFKDEEKETKLSIVFGGSARASEESSHIPLYWNHAKIIAVGGVLS